MTKQSTEEAALGIVEDVGEAPPEEKEGALKEIVLKAREQILIERAISKKEAELKILYESLKEIREIKLPNAMEAAGLKDMGLDNGWRVELNIAITAAIPKDKREEGCNWCEENEAYDLVKHTIEIDVGRQRADSATRRSGGGALAIEKLKRFLKRLKFGESFVITEKRTVMPQTLGKMVRERLVERAKLEKRGVNDIPKHLFLPEQLLGVHRIKHADLVPPKKDPDEL